MFEVTNLKVVGSSIILEFNKENYRVFDMMGYFLKKEGPVIDELIGKDAKYQEVKIVDGTLQWSNGYDIDPEVL